MIETWLSTLSPGAQFVARTAIALNVNLVEAKPLVGGCYHLAFFLFEYLRSIAGIDVVPIVGWVNDGRDDFMISHAWIEFEGKVTDVSLTKTEYPEEQLSGALVVHGHEIRPGQIQYTYHKARTANALFALRGIDPVEAAELEALHEAMVAVSISPKKIRKYLKSAPRELAFHVLLDAVRL